MAIQMRRGALDKLDRSKLLPGEFAICEDGTVVICYATGKTKVVTSLELENARVSADGTVYETLKERLDQEYNQLTKELENDFSQLSEENAELKGDLNSINQKIENGEIGGEPDVYGFYESDYTVVDLTDQFTAAVYNSFVPSTNNNSGTCLSPIMRTPQKYRFTCLNPSANINNMLFCFGSNPEDSSQFVNADARTTGYEPRNGRFCGNLMKGSNIVNGDVIEVYTHEFGRVGYEYCRLRWTNGTFASWIGKFKFEAFYTDKRPSYHDEIKEKNELDGYTHDVEPKFALCKLMYGGKVDATTREWNAIVPYYPNRKYLVRGGAGTNTNSINIDYVTLLFDDRVLENYYSAPSGESGVGGCVPMYLESDVTTDNIEVVAKRNSGSKFDIIYTCNAPAGMYPKWVAIPIGKTGNLSGTSLGWLVNSSLPIYPYDDDMWENLKTVMGESQDFVSVFDEWIYRKWYDTDFIHPFIRNTKVKDDSLLPFFGKTLTVFGDSISDSYGGKTYADDGFWSKICREFHMRLDNRAKAGSNLCISREAYASVSGVYMLDAYLDAVEANEIEQSDIIIIEFGTNCYQGYEGNPEDTSEVTTASYYGAMRYFIENLREKSPKSVFGFLLNHDVNWGLSGQGVKDTGATNARRIIKEVCEEYRVPYADTYNDSGLTSDMLSDGVHIGTDVSFNLYYRFARQFVWRL